MQVLRDFQPIVTRRSAILGLVTVLTVSVATFFGAFEFFELKAIDTAFSLRGPVEAAAPIVIVAIDDESLRESGQGPWPWPRAYFAELISRIASGGPRVITVDVFWYEPSREAGGDAALARAIAEAGNVILANDINKVEQRAGDLVFETQQYRRPLPELDEAAASLGLANYFRDGDGFIRRMPLFLINPTDGKAYFSWSAVTALRYLNVPVPDSIQPRAVQFGTLTVPHRDGLLSVNYRGGPGKVFRQIPAYQFVNGDQNPAILKDKIVLIGSTSVALQDNYPVPFEGSSNLMPGVEIHANVIDTILSRQFISRWPAGLGALAVLGLGLLAFLFSTSDRPLVGLWFTLGTAVVYLGAWWLAFSLARVEMYVVVPLTALLLGFAGPSVDRAVNEALEKRRVRGIFERFVSPEMVEQLIDRGVEASHGQRTELTILFSDIRGFTTMAEKMAPEEVVDMLNEYLEAMSEVILRHGGTIDKYEGDLIMAFFNAPIPQPDHARRAVEASIDMRLTLDTLKDKWAQQGNRPTHFEMGIGLNTGEAFVGLIGSRKRINYTCIGDSVNLASRVQDLTKDLQWPLVITEFTYARIKDEFDAELAEARMVRGRSQPVRMYRVLGRRGAPESERVRPLFA